MAKRSTSRGRRVAGGIAAVLIGILIFAGLTRLFQPKYYFSTEAASPETEMWRSFYDLPKDSLDIVFLGSSHMYNAVDPVAFEAMTGLSGFDLATSNQDLSVSYYCLRELLRFQKPEVIVFDAYGFELEPFEKKSTYKRTFDDMAWSSVKMGALRDWMPHMEGEKWLPRFLTLLDYHSRWEELTDADIHGEAYVTSRRGFCPFVGAEEGVISFDGIDGTDATPVALSDLETDYFRKILALCRNNDITLVMIKTPSALWNIGKHEAVAALAEAEGVPFLDYNTNEAIAHLALRGDADWRNTRHLNENGAARFTKVLAEDLAGGAYISVTEK
ncbi:MAG: hypothetical protein Q4B73_03725 [Lachnospiraceae bacterium]|nr:hypothetical protein [Lachnospiraceae bacterium]